MTVVLNPNGEIIVTEGYHADCMNAVRYVRDAYNAEPLFVLRARDLLSLPTIEHYRELSTNVSPPSINGMPHQIQEHINRFREWQYTNSGLLKFADPYVRET